MMEGEWFDHCFGSLIRGRVHLEPSFAIRTFSNLILADRKMQITISARLKIEITMARLASSKKNLV